MFFTSFDFFVFFPCVVILFYIIPHRFRWVLLLLSSSLFYLVFSWHYLLLLYGVILVNYLIGKKILSRDGRLNRLLYISGILFNILVLCFFKYFNYLEIDFTAAAGFFHLHYPVSIINILFPLGLSYFIFTSLSYLIDIKRGEVIPERNPGILASYFLFFLKLYKDQ